MVTRITLMTLALAFSACAPPDQAPSIANARLAAPTPEFDPQLGMGTRQRVLDLIAINHALLVYQSGHGGTFPRSQAFDGYLTLGERWIPQIAGRYISPLPRDPKADERGAAQYVYWSDGRDFKLIAKDGGDCSAAVEVGGVRRDPARSDASGCSAFGIWSPGAENK